MDVVFYLSAATLVAILLSIPVLLLARKGINHAKYVEEIAPDAKYDVRYQKFFLSFWATAGLAAAILLPLMGTRSIETASRNTILKVTAHFLGWAYISLLSGLLIASTRYYVVFRLTCHIAAISCLQSTLALLLLSGDVNDLFGKQTLWEILFNRDVLMETISTVSAILVFCVSITIPSGPQMEYRDRSVVGLANGSIWSIASFSYIGAVTTKAHQTSALEQSDLERLPLEWRASYLLYRFAHTRHRKYGLFRRLVITFKGPLILQWSLSVLQAGLTYGPAFFLLQILNFIEEYESQSKVNNVMSIYPGLGYVFGMLVVNQVLELLDSQVYQVSGSVLMINTRAALSLEIYDKTLKRKDTIVESSSVAKDAAVGKDTDETNSKEASENTSSKQNVLNLMNVDADRIAEFALFNVELMVTPIQLAISMSFLVKLVGWAAVPGFLAMCLFIPLTAKTSSIYETTQDKLMKAKDRRVSLMNEILQNIRQIKFQADERYFSEKVHNVRNQELRQVSISYMAYIGLDFCFNVSPVVITVVIFGVYAKFVADLTPAIAFTSLVIMNQMRYSLNLLPDCVVMAISAWTSLKRIESYLDGEEIEPVGTVELKTDKIVLSSVTAGFAGAKDAEDGFRLRNVSVTLPANQLCLITGATGSGKTLLLNTMLGEAHVFSGLVNIPKAASQDSDVCSVTADPWIVPNTIAYVAQTAWLENKTIQDNILFGTFMDRARYKEVLSVCGLELDLQILEDGDQTEIGEKGINLSGGQKARVSLARAAYSRAAMVIMDDVLSALDAHVSRHVFENCINGKIMKNRTRILVTHQVNLCLPAADYIITLDNGEINYAGTVNELQHKGSLPSLVEELRDDVDELQKAKEELAVESLGQDNPENQAKNTAVQSKKPRKLVDEESKHKGTVTLKCYTRYLSAYGSPLFILAIVLLSILDLGLSTLGSYWIRVWSSSDNQTSLTLFTGTKQNVLRTVPHVLCDDILGSAHTTAYWIVSYTVIMLASQAASLLATGLTYWGTVAAGRSLYMDMLRTIMQAPLRFLDTVPTGRLLNRFSKDATTVDTHIGTNIIQLLNNFLQLIVIVAICVTVQPWFLLAAAVLVAFGMYIGLRYVSTARSLKRLDSVNESPLYETFSSTLAGITTIRAFGSSDRFMEGMYVGVERVSTARFYNLVANRWLGVRFGTVGNFYSSVMALVLLLNIEKIDAGLAGFILSFALELQGALLWLLRSFSALEQSMNAVERMFEYTDILTEADHESKAGQAPPAAWPTQGTIEFKNLELKYAPELPSVLHKISFQTKPREKIGIVGRTGSGKTSITLALFRFLEATHGSIEIDGLDIAKMGLRDLRSRMTIVPQEPTLFRGTLRSNLSEDASDADLHDVLRRVHLTSDGAPATESGTNRNVFANLDTEVTESGANFSAGQKQLLCLARALLRRTKIIVMDEATASVSSEIDTLIQETIRHEFIDSTVLTIAHRLETIIDYERILVLGEGNVLELDTPANLLADPESRFSEMVRAANVHIP
ncbi:Putative uncharacterized protein [Taphrina deformans PYCC 5710]|uniref:P-loop containing nucleoside triphosphate hydrolase protein n=1 Tax=Taphrina deformans (strain PYCC 5710 / ATCC 11124 / CBS 356.35 / IMI 108563 / JCM 9778 / NBRC 8474) TaxID=1097556 RepID=R4XAR4_TAPDE|nr:Putative uncharacterized protein [Taphrina deformans PYCC 5710]|eukprot:CCG81413.1 Putative uncharacterized protein [Taphrina deformans PYCC 5710]